MQASSLQTQNLHKSFSQAGKTLSVLNDISITFDQGKSYAITGASGSGKSTFLHLLGGLDKPTSGSVRFNTKDLSTASLGFVFQFHYLVHEMTALENIYLMGLIKGQSRQKCIQKAKKLLERVGLTDKAESYPYQLSGGEQQRISIVRAIFNEPDFLLADEPTGNLDAANAEQLVDFVLQCQKEWNMGIVLCSHDAAVYQRMDQVFVLKDGALETI